MNIDMIVYNEAKQLVDKWDFSLLREKMQEPSHAGWALSRIDSAIEDYRKYMAVTKALGGIQLVPNGEIDRIWHEHILDTRQYAKDCLDLFGGFLHHYPYFGMRSSEDKSNWVDTTKNSNELWQSMFGENLYNTASSINKEPMKCPQACPDGGVPSIQAANTEPMKCPQACPNGNSASIDYDYKFLKAA